MRTQLYNLTSVSLRRTHLIALGLLLVLLVALYPQLESMGACEGGGCPPAAQSSQAASASLTVACVGAAVLATASAGAVFSPSLGRLLFAAAEQRPHQLYLAPEPPPPRLLSNL